MLTRVLTALAICAAFGLVTAAACNSYVRPSWLDDGGTSDAAQPAVQQVAQPLAPESQPSK